MNDELFSRERLAGYAPTILAGAVVVIVGCGAAGTNMAQTLSLSGVGELRFIDPDRVEPSNLPRSPLFLASRLRGKRVRFKASECATRALEISHAETPVMRYAVSRVEELGLGAFRGADVIVAAADSFAVRARLADAARRLGITLVEVGFSGHRGQVSVWRGTAAKDDACWRCAFPHIQEGGAGCSLYAAQAIASGMVPATQPLAGTLANLAAFHVLEALHDRFPLSGKIATFDLRESASRVAAVTPDPACPGVHRAYQEAREIALDPQAPLSGLFDALGRLARDPLVRLRDPIILEMPCVRCGASVQVGLPSWKARASACAECPEVPRFEPAGVVSLSSIDRTTDLGVRREVLGILPGAFLEVTDRATGREFVVRIKGEAADLYATLTRKARNAVAPSDRNILSAATAPERTTDHGKAAADQDQLPAPPRLA